MGKNTGNTHTRSECGIAHHRSGPASAGIEEASRLEDGRPSGASCGDVREVCTSDSSNTSEFLWNGHLFRPVKRVLAGGRRRSYLHGAGPVYVRKYISLPSIVQ